MTLPEGLEERHRLDTGNSFWRTIPGVLGVQVRQVGVLGRLGLRRPPKTTLEKESLGLRWSSSQPQVQYGLIL